MSTAVLLVKLLLVAWACVLRTHHMDEVWVSPLSMPSGDSRPPPLSPPPPYRPAGSAAEVAALDRHDEQWCGDEEDEASGGMHVSPLLGGLARDMPEVRLKSMTNNPSP
jgi:hypothetical protein